jgi:tripartite-type tricarboxylate transporter receptor subunit TctC
VVDRLSEALQEALKLPDMQERYRQNGEEFMLMSSVQFNEFVSKKTINLSKLVSDFGIPKQ